MATKEQVRRTEHRLGTKSLARTVSTYLACLAFPLVYLLSIYVGAWWGTALFRGIVGSMAIFLVGPLLFHLLADTILSAISEAQARKREDDK